MLTRERVAATASAWARGAIAEVDIAAPVLHAGHDAIYFDIGSEVLAVVSRTAVAVPCALQTTLSTLSELTASSGTARVELPAPGTLIHIRDGAIHFAHAEVRIGRIVDYRAPAFDPGDAAAMRADLRATVGNVLEPIRAELPSSALQALQHAEPRSVHELMGLGSGLTPLGDDVLCGWLATLMATDRSSAATISAAVNELADEQTTRLSATLLRRAIAGDVVPQFCRLLRALQTPLTVTDSTPTGSIATASNKLARIGHTSGAGLLLGLSIALEYLITRSNCP